MKTLRPTKIDPRDRLYHFDKFFGAASSFSPDFRIDNGNTVMPDQDVDGRPQSCSAYTVTDIAFDKDGATYSRDFQMMATLETMSATDPSKGADARKAFSVAPSIGMLLKTQEPAGTSAKSQIQVCNPGYWPTSVFPSTVKEGGYFPIVPNNGYDWFDSIRSAISLGHSIGMATQWSDSFESTSNGMLTDSPISLFWGHMYKASGWKTINGEPYLLLKTWQGSYYGAGGWCYMSRKLCNRLMSASGTYAATLSKDPISPADTRITLIQTLMALLRNLLTSAMYSVGLI